MLIVIVLKRIKVHNWHVKSSSDCPCHSSMNPLSAQPSYYRSRENQESGEFIFLIYKME